jgi:hypothetical protein
MTVWKNIEETTWHVRVRRRLFIGVSLAPKGGSHAHAVCDCHVASESIRDTKPGQARRTMTPLGMHVGVTQHVLRRSSRIFARSSGKFRSPIGLTA